MTFTSDDPFNFEDNNLFLGWAIKGGKGGGFHIVDTHGYVEYQLRLVETDAR